MSRKHQTPKREWQPLERAGLSDESIAVQVAAGVEPPDRVYRNDRYSVFVREIGHGALHVSFHRHDRSAIVDWRHCQQIKNEVAGAERTAVEIFPPESKLVDTANERHLWVLPPGETIPFAFDERLVMTQDEMEAVQGRTKARQRPWERGLTTGQPIR